MHCRGAVCIAEEPCVLQRSNVPRCKRARRTTNLAETAQMCYTQIHDALCWSDRAFWVWRKGARVGRGVISTGVTPLTKKLLFNQDQGKGRGGGPSDLEMCTCEGI